MFKIKINPYIIVLSSVALLAACVSSRDGLPTDYYYNFELTPPKNNTVTVCHGYGCRFETEVTMGDAELARVREIFAGVEDTPQGEREAVSRAVSYFETHVGEITGTREDRAEIETRGIGDPHQQDCVDEATNTTSYLIILDNNGFLKHHTVRRPEVRGYWLDGRWPHWTAVLQLKDLNEEWAVDSWWRNNGVEPVVIPLAEWYKFDEEQREDPDTPYPGIQPRSARQQV